jgi:hypothetical protein
MKGLSSKSIEQYVRRLEIVVRMAVRLAGKTEDAQARIIQNILSVLPGSVRDTILSDSAYFQKRMHVLFDLWVISVFDYGDGGGWYCEIVPARSWREALMLSTIPLIAQLKEASLKGAIQQTATKDELRKIAAAREWSFEVTQSVLLDGGDENG